MYVHVKLKLETLSLKLVNLQAKAFIGLGFKVQKKITKTFMSIWHGDS